MKRLMCITLFILNAWVCCSVCAQESKMASRGLYSMTMQSEISGDEVTIEWFSGHEINVRYFMLERSFDEENYTTLAFVPAKNRYPAASHYQFCDREVQLQQGAPVYYRLRMVDMNGASLFTKMIVEKDSEGLISRR